MPKIERQPSEFELNKSRAISDGELLAGGAELVPGANGPRLGVTPEWIRAHMWQYLSWVKANYGSLEAFQKTISSGTEFEDEAQKREERAA